jgi:hypothetical protein
VAAFIIIQVHPTQLSQQFYNENPKNRNEEELSKTYFEKVKEK